MNLFSKIININFHLSKTQWLLEQKIKATASILIIVAFLLSLFSIIRFVNLDIVAGFADGFGAFLFIIFLHFLKKDVKFYNLISILALGILSLVITIGLFTSQHDILRGIWFISFMPLISYLRDFKESIIWMFIYVIIMIVSYLYSPEPNIVGYFLITTNIIVVSSVLYFYDKLKTIETSHIKNEKEILKEEVDKRTQELNQLNLLLEEKIKNEISKNKVKDKMLIQQSKMAMMGEMIGNITHQFRQPLSAIGSTSSSMLVNMELGLENSQEDIKKKLTNISSFVEHLSGTITDFRNFFKEDKEKELISFSKIVNDTLEIVEVSLKNKNINIITNIECEEKFETYSNELKQVLLNLIKNSEDALIENKVKYPTITIKTLCNNNCDKQTLIIQDNAGGIPPEIIEEIFKPYFSTKKEKDGTGLGLYMSKTIIEDHCKGHLSVKNDSYGAVFSIEFN